MQALGAYQVALYVVGVLLRVAAHFGPKIRGPLKQFVVQRVVWRRVRQRFALVVLRLLQHRFDVAVLAGLLSFRVVQVPQPSLFIFEKELQRSEHVCFFTPFFLVAVVLLRPSHQTFSYAACALLPQRVFRRRFASVVATLLLRVGQRQRELAFLFRRASTAPLRLHKPLLFTQVKIGI